MLAFLRKSLTGMCSFEFNSHLFCQMEVYLEKCVCFNCGEKLAAVIILLSSSNLAVRGYLSSVPANTYFFLLDMGLLQVVVHYHQFSIGRTFYLMDGCFMGTCVASEV